MLFCSPKMPLDIKNEQPKLFTANGNMSRRERERMNAFLLERDEVALEMYLIENYRVLTKREKK